MIVISKVKLKGGYKMLSKEQLLNKSVSELQELEDLYFNHSMLIRKVKEFKKLDYGGG